MPDFHLSFSSGLEDAEESLNNVIDNWSEDFDEEEDQQQERNKPAATSEKPHEIVAEQTKNIVDNNKPGIANKTKPQVTHR